MSLHIHVQAVHPSSCDQYNTCLWWFFSQFAFTVLQVHFLYNRNCILPFVINFIDRSLIFSACKDCSGQKTNYTNHFKLLKTSKYTTLSDICYHISLTDIQNTAKFFQDNHPEFQNIYTVKTLNFWNKHLIGKVYMFNLAWQPKKKQDSTVQYKQTSILVSQTHIHH